MPIDPSHPNSNSNSSRAHEWMDTHPFGMKHFREFAQVYKTLGAPFGINLLRELVRYQLAKERAARLHKEYFDSNDYSPFVARQLILEDPALGEFMVCKETKCGQ